MEARMKKENYSYVLNNIPVGYACHRRINDGDDEKINYEIIESNGEFEAITGISCDEMLGTDSAFILAGSEQNGKTCRDVHFATHYYAQKVEMKLYSESQEKWYEVMAFKVKDDHIVTTLTESRMNTEVSLYGINDIQCVDHSDVLMNTMMSALFEKNSLEVLHARRVSELCEAIALKMNDSELNIGKLKQAGMLHDIGKIAINSATLNKRGKLSTEEKSQLMSHSKRGFRILSSSLIFSGIADIVYMHHERLDGSGYPRGLRKGEISKEACIIAVAEAYETMTSYRSYKVTMNNQEALAELHLQTGRQFDPDVVAILSDVILNSKRKQGNN
jgi:HD-GYP domain-containing protein (c-di-GMP phosphodiesterase class II)